MALHLQTAGRRSSWPRRLRTGLTRKTDAGTTPRRKSAVCVQRRRRRSCVRRSAQSQTRNGLRSRDAVIQFPGTPQPLFRESLQDGAASGGGDDALQRGPGHRLAGLRPVPGKCRQALRTLVVYTFIWIVQYYVDPNSARGQVQIWAELGEQVPTAVA